MILLIIICLSLVPTSLTNSPQCVDVYHYLCPYDGTIVPKEALETVTGKYIGYSSDPKVSWQEMSPSQPSSSITRLICSNHKSAFLWGPEEFDVSSINNEEILTDICVDGKPRSLLIISKSGALFLNLKCTVQAPQPGPVVIKTQFQTYSWKNYDEWAGQSNTYHRDAVEGGMDKPQQDIAFHIGLVRFRGKDYVAKIIPYSRWMQIFPEHLSQPILVTGVGRYTKILCAENEKKFQWIKTDAQGGPIGNNLKLQETAPRVYRCKGKLEFILTNRFEMCRGKVEVVMLAFEPREFENEDYFYTDV